MSDNQEQPSMENHTKGKTILIVEDDDAFGEFLCQAISQETPHQPLRVPNGFQALEVIKEVTPGLVILDYYLPSMNGVELYDQLHATRGLERLPAIMTSPGVLEHDIQDRHIVGMSKPVELSKLLDIIVELIG
jgi:DNA-binding response OmpR family regulator